ncbi:hypothetical protein VTK26DRAFT_8432 [Humicola hyalothermophila]
MASPVGPDSTVNAVFVMSIVTAIICTLAAVLRFFATRSTGRKHSAEDWCAYGATAIHLVYISLTIHSLVLVGGRPLVTLPQDEIMYMGKANYAVPPLFAVNQLLTKSSLLLLYHRIFGIHRAFAYCIYVIGGINVAWFISVMYLFLFSCRPVSRGWNMLQPGTCLDYPATVAGAESINSAVDFAIAGLGGFMVHALRISTSTKLKLGILFAMGSFAGVLGIVKIVQTYNFTGAVNYMTGLWAIIQMACSIVCCCAPIYKPILPSKQFFQRIKSLVSTYGSDRDGTTKGGSQSYPTANSATLDKMHASVSLHTMPSSQSWLKLDDGTYQYQASRTTAWAEAGSGLGTPESQYQMHMINVHKTVEVV